MRVHLLAQFCEKTETNLPNVFKLNCSMNVVGLYDLLFKDQPMAIETKVCLKNCPNKEIFIHRISINVKDLCSKDVTQIIRETMKFHEDLTCSNCDGIQEKDIFFTGYL